MGFQQSSEIRVPLTIRDLTAEDLPGLTWAAPPLWLAGIARSLEQPEVENLVITTPSGASVAKGAIKFDQRPGAGLIEQLSVRYELQSVGIGTLLITASEERIRARGLDRAEMDVEVTNPRARALYERLGYVAYDSAPESWDHQHPDGTIERYETICTRMRKPLPTPAA